MVILMNFADHAPAHFHAWYGDYKVIISIKDGVVFEPLKDLNFFKRFSVKYNTVEWENGADFAPEYLLALPSVTF